MLAIHCFVVMVLRKDRPIVVMMVFGVERLQVVEFNGPIYIAVQELCNQG